MNSLMRRIEALERRRSAAVDPPISSSEVSGIKALLWRKLGLPVKSEDIVPAPLSRKAVEKARASALQKVRSFLERHRRVVSDEENTVGF
jgi:hypothetical protein